MTIPSVLLVCDNVDEAAFLAFVLKRAEMAVTEAVDLEQAMRRFVENPTDLIFLALRGVDLTTQARRARRDSEVCLAVIANEWDEEGVCDAFESGADAVIQRPYSARILKSRVRALLRRGKGLPLGILPSVSFGELALDASTRSVQVEGHSARRLTQLEFRLIYVLMLHRGQTVPTEIIVERVWGIDADAGMNLVRGLVRRLRSKVEPDPRNPRFIITEPSLGYRFESSED